MTISAQISVLYAFRVFAVYAVCLIVALIEAGASRLDKVTFDGHSATYLYNNAYSGLVTDIEFRPSAEASPLLAIENEYDFLNRLTRRRNGSATTTFYEADLVYNDLNQRTAATLKDDSIWNYGYDSLGQVTSGKRKWSPSGPLVAGQQFEYEFDTAGNRQRAGRGGNASGANLRWDTYAANSINAYSSRNVAPFADVIGEANTNSVVAVNNEATVRHGTYFRGEVQGNTSAGPEFKAITVRATLYDAVLDKEKEFIDTRTIVLPKAEESFGMDFDGNLTSDSRFVYQWDSENRLISVESNPAFYATIPAAFRKRLEFSYDHLGRRKTKKVFTWNTTSGAYNSTPESSLSFLYDGWKLIAELDELNSKAVVRSYVWGLDVSGTMDEAGGIGGLIAIKTASGAVHYAHSDQSLNVAGLVDAATGIVSATYEYGVFGEALRATGAMSKSNPFRFSTKYTDDETDLVYYGYRYYSANLGRWLSRDPLAELGGLNLLGFTHNDSINNIDTDGRFIEAVFAIATTSGTASSGGAGITITITAGGGAATGIAAATLTATGGGALLAIAGAGAYLYFDRPDPSVGYIAIPPGPGASVNAPPSWVVSPMAALPPRKPPGTSKAIPGFPGDDCERHHRLPQEFKNWFESSPRNLQIENYTKNMPMQWHRGQGIGIHSQGYNQAWQTFISQNPNASAQQVLQFLNHLEKTLGFGF